jgi:hypothetical protein
MHALVIEFITGIGGFVGDIYSVDATTAQIAVALISQAARVPQHRVCLLSAEEKEQFGTKVKEIFGGENEVQ